jgi:tryptophan-rich sensory protein
MDWTIVYLTGFLATMLLMGYSAYNTIQDSIEQGNKGIEWMQYVITLVSSFLWPITIFAGLVALVYRIKNKDY